MFDDELRRYYNRNTDLFLRIGSSGTGHALHRGLWGPGVRNGREVAEHINELIARRIRSCLPREPRAVLDLACGVGGTLFSLPPDLFRYPPPCPQALCPGWPALRIPAVRVLQTDLRPPVQGFDDLPAGPGISGILPT